MHFVGGKVGSEVALDALLGTTLARLLFLALQMESGTGFASLGDAAVLDDGGLGLRVIFVMSEGVPLEQVGTCEGLGTDCDGGREISAGRGGGTRCWEDSLWH